MVAATRKPSRRRGGRADEAADLRRLICRLVCVPVRDHRGGGARALIEERAEHPWGGYILFGGEPEAVRGLLARLREVSPEPLLLAADLERGLGQQLASGTAFPPPMALGAARDPRLAYEVGEATGREAAALGLNCAFAPVLDLANEPANPIVGTRSFGDDPEAVGELGSALVRGLQEGGVLATAKHFPGHGRSLLDSHSALPVVEAGAAELRATDLAPFRRAIEAGAALVMSAHVAYPGLEGTRASDPVPATLSRAILGGLLREEMGFRGAVVSDALMMGALSGIEVGELAARALEAGVDCLLYPPRPRQLVDALALRVEAGELSPEVLERARRRIGSSLDRLGERARGTALPSPAAAAGAAQGLALRAARAGLVALGDTAPARPGGRSLVLLLLDGGIGREEVVLPSTAAAPRREFRWLLAEEESPALPEDLAAFDDVYLAYYSPVRAWKGRAGLSAGAAALASSLLRARPDVILISFSSPFILPVLPAPRGAILAFGEVAACQFAVGEVLAGQITPAGRLPVRLEAPPPLPGASS